MHDIRNREDIKKLIDTFYSQVLKDELIGHFFTDVIKLDFNKHLPTMYDFWDSTLLGAKNYKGNPMQKHIELNQLSPLLKQHFDRWLNIWEDTVRSNFKGEKAMEAIERARHIAALMNLKINTQI